MGFGSNTSLDETINTPETEKPITPGNSSESNSEASICSSTASLSASKSATAASTPSTAPLNDEDHFKSLSISNLEKAPSLPFLSNLQPERATTATLLIANCKGCARPISSAQACLSAIGFMWHSECFKCANTQCAKQIGQGSFYQRGRFCYCESCWKGDCCPKCEECGNPIDDRKEQTLVQGHAYHKTCFTCSLCEKPLLPMTQFVEPGGVRCCLPCYAEVHGKRCRGCGDMCTADFVSVSRGHTYHKVCITCSVCYRTLEDCHTFYQQGGVFFCDEHHTPDEARKVSGEEKSEAEYEVDEKNTYVDESTIANSSSGEHTS
ncbi:hypothetical protein BC830DRAFT_64651 [Chytriomyces sp. MP71]|nr:hypothetical protein BC830DRAFT_64651 [Chytriomyces sp. MP71]